MEFVLLVMFVLVTQGYTLFVVLKQWDTIKHLQNVCDYNYMYIRKINRELRSERD